MFVFETYGMYSKPNEQHDLHPIIFPISFFCIRISDDVNLKHNYMITESRKINRSLPIQVNTEPKPNTEIQFTKFHLEIWTTIS